MRRIWIVSSQEVFSESNILAAADACPLSELAFRRTGSRAGRGAEAGPGRRGHLRQPDGDPTARNEEGA